jgi:hypothetical protein
MIAYFTLAWVCPGKRFACRYAQPLSSSAQGTSPSAKDLPQLTAPIRLLLGPAVVCLLLVGCGPLSAPGLPPGSRTGGPFEGQYGFFNCVAFSPDGKTLATGSVQQHEVFLWEVATGRVRACLRGPYLDAEGWAAFTPDGKSLVTLCDKEVRLLDLATGKAKALRRKPTLQANSAALSRDGRFLAFGHLGGTELQDVAAGKELATLRRKKDRNIRGVAFSPDGKTLAAGARTCRKRQANLSATFSYGT